MPQAILTAVLCAIAAGSTVAVVLAILQRRLFRAALHDALGEVTEGLRFAAAPQGERPEVYPDGIDISLGASATRMALPMSSGVSIPIGASVEITSRPHNASFQPDQIVIENPEEWAIDVVTVDDRPQLAQATRADRVGPSVPWDVVGRGKRISMTVTYVGDREEGAPFVCTLLGFPLDLGGPVDPRLFAPDAGAGAVAR